MVAAIALGIMEAVYPHSGLSHVVHARVLMCPVQGGMKRAPARLHDY